MRHNAHPKLFHTASLYQLLLWSFHVFLLYRTPGDVTIQSKWWTFRDSHHPHITPGVPFILWIPLCHPHLAPAVVGTASAGTNNAQACNEHTCSWRFSGVAANSSWGRPLSSFFPSYSVCVRVHPRFNYRLRIVKRVMEKWFTIVPLSTLISTSLVVDVFPRI